MKVMRDANDYNGPFPCRKKPTLKERLATAVIITAISIIMTMLLFNGLMLEIERRENIVNNEYNVRF